MSLTSDINTLDLAAFVAGYLAMIKLFDSETTKHMLHILELLMRKAMSYSWTSVRAFYYYLARQVEQGRLEWNDIPAIREMVATSFNHSDLHSVHVNSTCPLPPQKPDSNAGTEQPKGCQTWEPLHFLLLRSRSFHLCLPSCLSGLQIGRSSHAALSEMENAKSTSAATKRTGLLLSSTASVRPRTRHGHNYG